MDRWSSEAATATPTRVPAPGDPDRVQAAVVEAAVEPDVEPAPAPPAPLGAATDPTADPVADPERPPSGDGRFRLGHRPELDGLRALSMMAVVFHHLARLLWPEASEWILPGGQVGLDMFFALSGFLITALLLSELQRTGRIGVLAFLWRRVLRLVPALVAMMAGLTVVSFVGEKYGPGELLSSAGWTVTLSTNLAIDRPIVELIHTWSLSVEAHFYVFWCVTVALVATRARRPYHVLAGIAVAVIVAVAVGRAVVYHEGADALAVYVNTLHRLDGPLTGALAGVALVAGWLDGVPRRLAAWAGAVGMAGLVVAAFRTTPVTSGLFEGLFTVVAACAAVVVVAAPLSGGSRLRRAISIRPLVALGAISYSVYLWHMPVFFWFERNVREWPVAGKLAVSVAVAFGVGAASYHLVERPFLRRKARVAAQA